MPAQGTVVDVEQFKRDEDFILRQWKDVTIDGWDTKILDIGETALQ